MSAQLEKLSRISQEDPNDPLNPKVLSKDIQTIGEALQKPFKLLQLAREQQMDKYSWREIVIHYTNHRRQYQSFYETLHGKKRISEGEVTQFVAQGRRGRK